MSQNINLEEEKKDKEDNNIVSNNELNEEPIIKREHESGFKFLFTLKKNEYFIFIFIS